MTDESAPIPPAAFTPVPPGQRQRRVRAASRVVVVARNHVLLCERFDPGVPGSRWWDTPGGGIDPGETPAQAALREVWEETGIEAEAADLLGPVARQLATHGYSDRITDQTEYFFVLRRAGRVEVTPRRLSARERLTTGEWRWFDLAAWPEPDTWFWADVPALLALAERGGEPVDLGWVELSAVPAGAPA